MLRHLLLEVDVHVADFSDLVKYRRYYRQASSDGEDEDQDEYGIEDFNYETPKEVQPVQSLGNQEAGDDRSLRSFRALRHLRLSICLLYYFACGIGLNLDLSDLSWSLADYLPPQLESLQLFVPDRGEELNEVYPMFYLHCHISKLMEDVKKAKLPSLKFVEFIPPSACRKLSDICGKNSRVDSDDSEEDLAETFTKSSEDLSEGSGDGSSNDSVADDDTGDGSSDYPVQDDEVDDDVSDDSSEDSGDDNLTDSMADLSDYSVEDDETGDNSSDDSFED